ncbi:MAG: hypothetical protein ACYDCK_07170 [Thermoplasmatota archaeon]
MDAGALHFNLLATAFQIAAAVALARARSLSREAKVFGSLLLLANAAATFFGALEAFAPSAISDNIRQAFDAPTPELLVAFVVWIPGAERFAKWRTQATVALSFIACIASAHAFVFGLDDTAFGSLVFEWGAVFVGYSASVLILASLLISGRSWSVEWTFGAVVLRGADFALRYTIPGLTSYAVGFAILPFVEAAAVAVALILVLRSAIVPSSSKVVIAVIAFGGAAFGATGHVPASSLGSQLENLVTLVIGRPALLAVAFLTPGAVAPFFRGSVLATLTYLATVIAANTLGLIAPDAGAAQVLLAGGASLVVTAGWWYHGTHSAAQPAMPTPAEFATATASPPVLRETPGPSVEQTDYERLLGYLGGLPPGAKVTRAEIAEALGVLPRNVHRTVEAANRSREARPGEPVVEWAVERGRANQVQYHYWLRGHDGTPPVSSVPR